jgi:ketosteroid isomerase-like protein
MSRIDQLNSLKGATPMTTATQSPLHDLLTAFQAKELDAALACFANDAVFVDPHYP